MSAPLIPPDVELLIFTVAANPACKLIAVKSMIAIIIICGMMVFYKFFSNFSPPLCLIKFLHCFISDMIKKEL